MAEGFLKRYAPKAEVHSAGTAPAERVHPLAVKVMQEKGIDLSAHRPKSVDQFLNQAFDYVITVCGEAEKNCPAFMGTVQHRQHIGFEDPAKVVGTEEFTLSEFRRIRDEIGETFRAFLTNNLGAG